MLAKHDLHQGIGICDRCGLRGNNNDLFFCCQIKIDHIGGDPCTGINQQNVKQGLADFTQLVTELRQGVQQIEEFSAEAIKLIEQTSVTVKNLDVVSQEVNQTVQGVAPRIQTAADEMAQSLNQLTELLERLTQGQGTAGRIVNDPRLYESLVDAADNMKLTMIELRAQIALWKEHGIFYKDK